MNSNFIRFGAALAVVVGGILILSGPTSAQSGAPPTLPTVPVAQYAATTANTSSTGDTVRFVILRWSTDAERSQAMVAMKTGDAALASLIQKAPTIGYVWTTESAGYSLRYAYRSTSADGGDRVILVTDKILGSFEPQRWKVTGTAAPTNYPFTLIELHMNKVGPSEGKSSLTAKVAVDKDGKSLGLENYATAPVVFQGVKR